ncbi:MAG: DCC1-like thiol-disulfide oxidoreductase family protein [Pyrinomonadaceae bacterium]
MKLKYEIALIVSGVLLILGPMLLWRRAPRFIRDFFTATTAPVNLALFRIVFFVVVLFSFSVNNVAWFGSLPAELRFPPTGLRAIIAGIPINESFARSISVALVIVCLACIFGLFTRGAIIICLALSLYVLGVPQFFGKINHYHHLIWFMAVLAASPCSDVLSLDAVWKSWKRADRGNTAPPEASQAYALPLRFIWLLMGVIYFSAGFWKVWTAGVGWAWSDNPRNMMYNKWMELSGWTPIFRIDHYPLLYKLSATATILFELSFIFLIFFASVRYLAPIGGLLFHNMTNVFMRISFWNLQACYVAFVDWNRLFRFFGRRLFPEEMYLLYDGNCKLCRRTIASFRVFDICERVTYVNALDVDALKQQGLSWLDSEALMRHMHVVVGSKVWTGFAAYRKWIARLPLFWVALPLLFLPPVAWAGRRIYERVAASRTCSLITKPLKSVSRPRRAPFAIAVVGSFLVYVTILSAIVKLQSWPFALYPAFEDPDVPRVGMMTMSVEASSGTISEIKPNRESSLTALSPERLMGMQNRLMAVESPSERGRRLQAFWRLLVREHPPLAQTRAVRFYRDTVSSLPDDRDNNLLRRELIYEFRVDSPEFTARAPGVPE